MYINNKEKDSASKEPQRGSPAEDSSFFKAVQNAAEACKKAMDAVDWNIPLTERSPDERKEIERISSDVKAGVAQMHAVLAGKNVAINAGYIAACTTLQAFRLGLYIDVSKVLAEINGMYAELQKKGAIARVQEQEIITPSTPSKEAAPVTPPPPPPPRPCRKRGALPAAQRLLHTAASLLGLV
ncbi:MAG: hypothetical protein Q7R81_01810 [Candidatus Peregrinibacteria bacterium]|nr:hypothetical protein [Candidatus Peregrinibacteria bacterium]